MEELVRQQKVVLTPCKNLPGNYSTSYDDRLILEIAASFDAAIVSNDNFADLLNEKSGWYPFLLRRDPRQMIRFLCIDSKMRF